MIKSSTLAGNAPCKGCSCRRLRCHSECEKYAEWKRKIAEIEGKRHKALEYYAYQHDKIVEEEFKLCKSSKAYKERFERK